MAFYDLLPWRRQHPSHMQEDEHMPLRELQREFNTLFDTFFSTRRSPYGDESASGTYMPQINITEEDAAYTLTAELPGMTEKDISVDVEGNHLVIRGEKKEENTQKKKGRYVYQERRYGRFERYIPLRDEIARDEIAATYAKGVLTVRLPKTADAARTPAKRIPVKEQ